MYSRVVDDRCRLPIRQAGLDEELQVGEPATPPRARTRKSRLLGQPQEVTAGQELRLEVGGVGGVERPIVVAVPPEHARDVELDSAQRARNQSSTSASGPPASFTDRAQSSANLTRFPVTPASATQFHRTVIPGAPARFPGVAGLLR
jgi:hypothetical protein